MKIIRIISAFFLVFAITFTWIYGRHKISAENSVTKSEEYQGVITLWQIDSFEGGVGSRKQFLLKIAREFEKKNNGVLVMVVNMTKEGAEENFKNGIYPDMISYGNGVQVERVSELKKTVVINSGLVGDKLYATAWCRGGYVLISNNERFEFNEDSVIDNLTVSQAKYTQPLIALLMENIKVNNVEILSPMDAYVKFVSGKTEFLLGTQRDINRLNIRGMNVKSILLASYNDLYQYISVTTENQMKRFYSEEFINFLLSKNSQDKLAEIGMMSCFYNVKYDNEHLSNMQKLNNFMKVSAFIPEQKLKEMHELAPLALKGDEQAKIKIKNMLV